MAIKGKGRTKSKQVTRAPRQAYTPPTPPLPRRRWVQVTAAFVAGILVILFTAWVRNGLADQSEERDERRQQAGEQTAIRAYRGEVDPILGRVGEPTPPIGFTAFADLGQVIAAFGKGEADESEAKETASATQETASEAAKAMAQVDAAEIVGGKGLSAAFASGLIDATSKIHSALLIYAESALALERAADADGSARSELLASATELEATATELFGDGYNDYTLAQEAAGVLQPQIPAGGGQVPQVPLPPGG